MCLISQPPCRRDLLILPLTQPADHCYSSRTAVFITNKRRDARRLSPLSLPVSGRRLEPRQRSRWWIRKGAKAAACPCIRLRASPLRPSPCVGLKLAPLPAVPGCSARRLRRRRGPDGRERQPRGRGLWMLSDAEEPRRSGKGHHIKAISTNKTLAFITPEDA